MNGPESFSPGSVLLAAAAIFAANYDPEHHSPIVDGNPYAACARHAWRLAEAVDCWNPGNPAPGGKEKACESSAQG